MQFSRFAKWIEEIEKNSSRLFITKKLAGLFRVLNADEIRQVVYLLLGRVGPLYEKIEFGMAEKMVIRAVCLGLQIEDEVFIREYRRSGDLGKATEALKKEARSLLRVNHSIISVFKKLRTIAESSGEGSQETKIKHLAQLIQELDALSCRYVVRIPTGVLRLGFSDMTILDAFSWMLYEDKRYRSKLQNAYHIRPDLGTLGFLMKKKGIEGISFIEPELFTPILMMRAERLSQGSEIIKKIGECIVEPKYDGFRLQVHFRKKDKKVVLFSRNLENVTQMYPDVVNAVLKGTKAETCIFEGEAVGYDPKTNTHLPFQTTVVRKRKYDVAEKAREIPLKMFVFELLLKDGFSYVHEPFSRRRDILEKTFLNEISKSNLLVSAPSFHASDEKRIDELFHWSINQGYEGIIAKRLDGIYQPGARDWNWIKYKRSYEEKAKDTVDCLVMGYDAGRGKRTRFGIGAFLAGIYDEKNDSFQTVAKIGTGLTDEEWREMKTRLSKHIVKDKPRQYDVDPSMQVDVWVAPFLIVEIRADEVTRSPVHTAGRKLKTSASGSATVVDIPGYALRFPRLEKVRVDKRPEDTTTITEISSIFTSSKRHHDTRNKSG